MLPEHIAKLREWQAEDDKLPQPVLSEFDLEEIQTLFESARMKRCMT
ncbi:YolD-like family protein [Sporosarcina sp. NCCP-2716]